MRTGLLLIVLLLMLPVGTSAQTFFSASLTPAQESAEVESDARGTAALALTPDGLRFFLTVNGLTSEITNAHFHRGAAGVDGPAIRGILESFQGNSATGIWTAGDAEPLTDEDIRDLFAGNLYLNVHTSNYPAGEIRGQIVPASGTGMEALLTSEQEGGDVMSDGSGTASLLLTEHGVQYYLTVHGLTGDISNAHFHRGEAGEDGPVVHGIFDTFDGNTAFGLWTPDDDQPLTDSLIVELFTGGLYLNVHSGQYPAGEIRGQVVPTGGWGFSAALDTTDQAEPVETEGSGTASLMLTDAGLIYRVTVTGLSGPITNAHFHHAPAGTDGPVVRGIFEDFDGNTATGVWRPTDEQPLSDEMIAELINGNLYLNVHSEQYPAGEIRGQIRLNEGVDFTAKLTPEQASRDIEVDAGGTAALTLTEEGLFYRVTVDSLSGDITNAHFHLGPVGVDGPVVHGIFDNFDGNTATGIWSPDSEQALTPESIQDLLLGRLYLNIHTQANQGGEIRGQVLLHEGTSLNAFLTNEQSGTDVQTASGTASVILTDMGAVYNVTVTGLSGDIMNAHFHAGAAGEDGPVVHGIFEEFEGQTATGVWDASDEPAFSSDILRNFLTGQYYLNVHTGDNPGGETRGQVYVNGGIGSAIRLDTEQSENDVTGDGMGTASLTLNEAGLLYDVTVADLTGPPTNAHFHEGAPGEGGPVVKGIFEGFEDGSTFGTWLPEDEQSLTNERIIDLLFGNLYLNVHTEANPAGEVRGQTQLQEITATSVEKTGSTIPESVVLAQNYPNPFNPETTINFSLPVTSHTVLTVYNLLGQSVARLVDEVMSAGEYRVTFDASSLPSGVYMYRLETNGTSISRKMLLLR